MSRAIAGHAVVVGAGIGGLTAAKALSAHFEKVTVLDRDRLPESPEPRPGTPQGRHTHALLAGGLNALEQLFPGLAVQLERAGAIRSRDALDQWCERPGFDPFPQRDLGFDIFCLSRALLEFSVRRRVETESNVHVRSNGRVVALVISSDGTSVTGVRCEDIEGKFEIVTADLVVEASGRPAMTLAALVEIGLEIPSETNFDIDQAYSTGVFEIPENAPGNWKTLLHLPNAPLSARGAFIVPIEGNRWSVTLTGNHGDAPPADIEGFMAFARTLRTATVHDAIRNARRLGEIVRFVLPSSTRRHFERLRDFPRGVIPIGDAICKFNPAFGQGMSVSAQEAVALDKLLRSRADLADPLDGFAQAFFADIQALLEAPWIIAAADLVYPKTRGERPPDFQEQLRFGDALVRLAAQDPTVHKIVGEVSALLKPQSALRERELVSRVRELMVASA